MLKPNMMLTNLEDIINVLLYEYGGKSYYLVPFHIQNSHRVIDIQFGTNGRGYAYVQRVWEIFGIDGLEYYSNLDDDHFLSLKYYSFIGVIPKESPIESIWVRETDSRELDVLYVFDRNGYSFKDTKPAIYTFDSVEVNGAMDVSTFNNNWHQIEREKWVSKADGTYRSCNFRSGNSTPITQPDAIDIGRCEREISYIEYPPMNRLYEMPDFLTNIEVAIWKQAKTLEFYYRERLVRKFQRCSIPAHFDNGWIEINLDYWDNCVNPEWLAYKQEIGLDE